MDCRGMTPEDYRYMMYWMRHEGNTGILGHMKQEGIDIRKNPVEFMTYEMTTRGRDSLQPQRQRPPWMDCMLPEMNILAGRPVRQPLAGSQERMPLSTRRRQTPRARIRSTEEERAKALFEAIRERENGETWQEVNVALNQTLFDYAGSIRYENMLKAGSIHLKRLKEKACGNLMARNPHELMHCLEVLNLLDLGELILAAVRKREETRDKYARLDFPFSNPMLDGKMLVCRRKGNQPTTEWRKIKL